MILRSTLILSIALFNMACSFSDEQRAKSLYESQCASCHILPAIEDLPKEIWENNVLPDMAARMGIRNEANNPLRGLSFDEQNAIIRTGVYPNAPLLTLKDWTLLKKYIVSLAPDSLKAPTNVAIPKELFQFTPRPVTLDDDQGALITFLKFDKGDSTLLTADMSGNLIRYDVLKQEAKTLMHAGGPITAYTEKDSAAYITNVGFLDPSEIARGFIQKVNKEAIEDIPIVLHRPVHTVVSDLDVDGQKDLIVSEFGDITGSLSLIYKKKDSAYQKRTLLNLPGVIRVLVRDMDKDGKKDIIALHSQGNEGITILYQREGSGFEANSIIRFSPVYGSSWFDLIDYDGDGDDDIITVNGDNADKSYVSKPYHGMRIFINDGENRFEENYFFPLYGATRIVARDFDKDGDIDFGLLSAFPDYTAKQEKSFVYLENENSKKFQFKSYTFKNSNLGRWFLMDAGDVDKDGDEDIILSSFTYVLTPVPDRVSELWKKSDADLMILENRIID